MDTAPRARPDSLRRLPRARRWRAPSHGYPRPCRALRAFLVALQTVPRREHGQTASGGCHALAAGDPPPWVPAPLPCAQSVPGSAADGTAPRARSDRLRRLPRVRRWRSPSMGTRAPAGRSERSWWGCRWYRAASTARPPPAAATRSSHAITPWTQRPSYPPLGPCCPMPVCKGRIVSDGLRPSSSFRGISSSQATRYSTVCLTLIRPLPRGIGQQGKMTMSVTPAASKDEVRYVKNGLGR